MTHPATFLADLKTAADAAAAAETAFRREAAERIAALERERTFAFRRLNLMRAVADAVACAEDEDMAVAGSLAVLRSKLGWSSDSETRAAVFSRFAPVAKSVFASLKTGDNAQEPDIAAALDEFETWYAATHAASFWALFEQYIAETPLVDF